MSTPGGVLTPGVFARISASVAYRARWAAFGVYNLQGAIRSVKLAGKRVTLSFPETERSVLQHELGSILFNDCYRLKSVDKPVHTVLDIGANVGLFALAARNSFPKAAIHCYEPNQAVIPHLASHCAAIGAHVHEAAVGEKEGFVSLDFIENSLHTVAKADNAGTIRVKSFSSVVEELGHIDLLKLDCEGAEWGIFRCKDVWSNVRAVTMEYHLWAKPNATTDDVSSELRNLGFSHIEIEPSPNGPWGFAWANRH